MTTPATTPARKPRIFYGWYIIGIASAAAVLGAGTSQLFLGVMLKPISEDTGWTRTAISAAATAGTWIGGLLAPLSGRLSDRYGPRVVITAGVVMVAAAYFALGRVENVWQFYAAYVFGRAMSSNTMGGVPSRTAAVNWFRRMRGRAMGMVSTAIPLGGAVLAIVAQALMSQGLTWRTVFVVFGIVMLAAMFLPSALMLRRRPEDLGLLPDGDAPGARTDSGEHRRTAAPEQSRSLKDAMGTPALWLIIVALAVSAWANSGVTFHLAAYYTDKGIAAGIAVAAISAYALSGAFANAMWGFLTERISERLLAVSSMAVAAGLCVFVIFVREPVGAFAFAILLGLAARGESSLMMLILAQYYGRNSFGTISGFATPFQQIGLGAGPLSAALIFGLRDTYTPVFLTSFGLFSVAVLCVWLARRPRGYA